MTKLSESKILEAFGAEDWAEAAVKIGYGRDFGIESDMDFTTPDLDPATAARAVRLIGRYNNFVGDDMGEAILQLAREGVINTVQIGRSGSPLVNFTLAGDTEDVLDDHARVVSHVLDELRADEVERPLAFRIEAWWD